MPQHHPHAMITSKSEPFENYLTESIQALEAMHSNAFKQQVQHAFDILTNSLLNNHKLLIAGNGGSAADAQHFAAELIGRFKFNRKALPAIALTTDSSVLTAIANDFGYEQLFTRQLEGLALPGDVLIGITTSGTSKNVLAALEMCGQKGISTIALTGSSGLQHGTADVVLTAPSSNTAVIQQCHEVCLHFLCSALEQQLIS